MTIISNVYAREVLDSRGNPTVEVEVRVRRVCSRNRSIRRFHWGT
jgi:enolase